METRLASLVDKMDLEEAKALVAEEDEGAWQAQTADDLAQTLLRTDLVRHAMNQVDWSQGNPLQLNLKYKHDSLTLMDALQAMRES